MDDDADRIVGLYERHARAWARERGTRLLEQAWLDRFCDRLPTGGHILDIGCGSAEPIASYFLEKGYWVTASMPRRP